MKNCRSDNLASAVDTNWRLSTPCKGSPLCLFLHFGSFFGWNTIWSREYPNTPPYKLALVDWAPLKGYHHVLCLRCQDRAGRRRRQVACKRQDAENHREWPVGSKTSHRKVECSESVLEGHSTSPGIFLKDQNMLTFVSAFQNTTFP